MSTSYDFYKSDEEEPGDNWDKSNEETGWVEIERINSKKISYSDR